MSEDTEGRESADGSEGAEDGYGPAASPEWGSGSGSGSGGDQPGGRVSLGKREPDPWAAPAETGPRDAVAGDVAQGEAGRPAGPAPVNPFTPPSHAETQVDPFAAPSSPSSPTPPAEPYNPFAPPSSGAAPAPGRWSQQPHPPHSHAQPPGAPYAMPPGYPAPQAGAPWAPGANPFAPPGEPVPPPPVSPDGPGQMHYGYPAAPYGYGRHAATGPAPMPYGGPGYGWPGMQPSPSNGMGVAALTLGIISAVVFILWPISIIVGILAIIFGAIGRAKAGRGEATNRGQALAGLICGICGLVLALVMMFFVIADSGSSSGSDSSDDSGYSAAL